ncbi:hypothetical protein [Neptuniibacter sp. QD37_11]|uniref:hypothetical protein n=1 Tax=Neptuniibacter sp. QD37_11 TaxID=3398209 RepID=UPI0039F5D51A
MESLREAMLITLDTGTCRAGEYLLTCNEDTNYFIESDLLSKRPLWEVVMSEASKHPLITFPFGRSDPRDQSLLVPVALRTDLAGIHMKNREDAPLQYHYVDVDKGKVYRSFEEIYASSTISDIKHPLELSTPDISSSRFDDIRRKISFDTWEKANQSYHHLITTVPEEDMAGFHHYIDKQINRLRETFDEHHYDYDDFIFNALEEVGLSSNDDPDLRVEELLGAVLIQSPDIIYDAIVSGEMEDLEDTLSAFKGWTPDSPNYLDAIPTVVENTSHPTSPTSDYRINEDTLKATAMAIRSAVLNNPAIEQNAELTTLLCKLQFIAKGKFPAGVSGFSNPREIADLTCDAPVSGAISSLLLNTYDFVRGRAPHLVLNKDHIGEPTPA